MTTLPLKGLRSSRRKSRKSSATPSSLPLLEGLFLLVEKHQSSLVGHGHAGPRLEVESLGAKGVDSESVLLDDLRRRATVDPLPYPSSGPYESSRDGGLTGVSVLVVVESERRKRNPRRPRPAFGVCERRVIRRPRRGRRGDSGRMVHLYDEGTRDWWRDGRRVSLVAGEPGRIGAYR